MFNKFVEFNNMENDRIGRETCVNMKSKVLHALVDKCTLAATRSSRDGVINETVHHIQEKRREVLHQCVMGF